MALGRWPQEYEEAAARILFLRSISSRPAACSSKRLGRTERENKEDFEGE